MDMWLFQFAFVFDLMKTWERELFCSCCILSWLRYLIFPNVWWCVCHLSYQCII